MKLSLGRFVYGLAAIGFGICALASNDANSWQQEIKALGDVSHLEIFSYIVAAVLIFGGAAVLFPKMARAGTAAVGAIYSVFTLLTIPFIFRHPLVYNEYGNFFEQFSFVAAALILYACSDSRSDARSARLAQFGYYSFGICVLSFGLEQLFYLANTASLVPKWIPPGQMFWAIATTVAFGFAAISLVAGFMARLGSRLLTAMLVGFGLIVWVPLLVADSHTLDNWSEGIETFGIAASAWIVAVYLSQRHSSETSAAGS